ncbi:hypothetical protein Ddc_15126 [Ditylenchus destructor]|nr:hypothetical protein Ddc_15126 [Ditylenchus destructor]
MRRSTEKKAKFENEARAQEPSAKKNRSDNRIRNMDDDTTVEVFKYLTYCGLAKTSLVSKQFCDLIRKHRNSLALLDVQSISMPRDNMQNVISWIKGHVHCYKIDITTCRDITNDDEFLNFIMTGANCTSKIMVGYCNPCKAIGDLIQKFIDLKSGGEDKVVESIECKNFECVELDALIRAHADFAVESNVNQTIGVSNHVFEFVNNDIGKKLRLTILVTRTYRSTEFTLEVSNL